MVDTLGQDIRCWEPGDAISDIHAASTGVMIITRLDPIDETKVTELDKDKNARWLSCKIQRRNQADVYVLGTYFQSFHGMSRKATFQAIKQFMKHPTGQDPYKPDDVRLVLGDFNANIIRPRNQQDKTTKQQCHHLNLKPLNSDLQQPTFYRDKLLENGQKLFNHHYSLIDYICTTANQAAKVNLVETLRVPIVSPDHSMVRVEFLDAGYEKRSKWKQTKNKIREIGRAHV